MTNSTGSGKERDQRAGRSPEPPVDVDPCGERQHPGGDSGPQAVDRARPVAIEGEQVLAGLEDRLDPLSDRGEVGTAAGLVTAPGPKQRSADPGDLGLEVVAGVALV